MIGKDEDHFFEFVVELISHHVPDLAVEAYTTRPSNGGTYLAVSVTIIAQSREQVDVLYAELGKHKRVRVAM